MEPEQRRSSPGGPALTRHRESSRGRFAQNCNGVLVLVVKFTAVNDQHVLLSIIDDVILLVGGDDVAVSVPHDLRDILRDGAFKLSLLLLRHRNVLQRDNKVHFDLWDKKVTQGQEHQQQDNNKNNNKNRTTITTGTAVYIRGPFDGVPWSSLHGLILKGTCAVCM